MLRKPYVQLLLLILLPLLFLFACTQYYVWIPDIVTKSEKLVGKYSSVDGHVFTVVQQWNDVDFYDTTLRVKMPDGTTSNYILDGDDYKRWNCQFKEDSGEVRIACGPERIFTFQLKTNVLIHPQGFAASGFPAKQ